MQLERDETFANALQSQINALSNAQRLVNEAIGKRTRELGPDHPETIRARLDLVELFRIAGRPRDARPVAEEAWLQLVDGPEANAALAAHAESLFGAVLVDLGELDQGEELLQSGLDKLLGTDGPLAAETRAAGERLAVLYEQTQRPAEAARVRGLAPAPDAGR